ncbi:N-formylglutamate amidohydrolase [Asticcacaulis biprosthecium]|uniref:N-formylglutamate amidohydrolase n=1 Tax=Asticcacaulis biprosthecium TaxID=76891 RepID=UPI0009FD3138|nr:N-formylglutamate amidohydrolase [Asticcacaulis biprosthecium]
MDEAVPIPWHLVHTPDKAVDVVRPHAAAAPVVFSLPHSGRYYPDSFVAEARQKGSALRSSEDAYVDDMVGLSPDLGVYGLACRYARAFCDVNRSPLELDARLIRGELPKAALALSARVKAGFGVIARRLSADQEIYRSPLDMAEVNRRLDMIHGPYHEALQDLLIEAGRLARPVVLIDWHSMPSSALASLTGPRPDIVLGNRHGDSCGDWLVRKVRTVLEGAGLRVGLNKPFAGGYIVERYGRPQAGVEALQIEINRTIYMDEATLEPHGGLDRLRGVFRSLTRSLVE